MKERAGLGSTLDAFLGDKGILEFGGEIAPVLCALGRHGNADRESGGRDVVASGNVEVSDAFIADGQAPDVDLATHAVDVDDKLHRGLCVGINKAM